MPRHRAPTAGAAAWRRCRAQPLLPRLGGRGRGAARSTPLSLRRIAVRRLCRQLRPASGAGPRLPWPHRRGRRCCRRCRSGPPACSTSAAAPGCAHRCSRRWRAASWASISRAACSSGHVALGLYDALCHGELVAYLEATEERFDLVVAADVFIYVGALEAAFAGVRRVAAAGALVCLLRRGGRRRRALLPAVAEPALRARRALRARSCGNTGLRRGGLLGGAAAQRSRARRSTGSIFVLARLSGGQLGARLPPWCAFSQASLAA